MAKRGRPKAQRVGPVSARVVRGPREDGRWYWRLDYHHGDGSRVSLRGVAGWMDAVEVAEALSRAMLAGAPDDAKPSDPALTTVRDLFEVYLGHLADERDEGRFPRETFTEYQRQGRRWTERVGSLPLAMVSYSTMTDHRAARLGDAAPATVRAELRALPRAMRWARREGKTDAPLPEVPPVRGGPTRNKRTPEPAEVEAVIQWLDAYPGHGKKRNITRRNARLVADALHLQRIYGARIGEVASLSDDRVDLAAGTVTLDGKTGPRVLPIVPDARAVLESHHGAGYSTIWRLQAETFRACVWSYVRRAVKALRQEPWTPHGLRRLRVDEALADGVPVSAVADWMGHSVAEAAKSYHRAKLAGQVATAARMGLLGDNVTPLDAARGHNPRSQVGE